MYKYMLSLFSVSTFGETLTCVILVSLFQVILLITGCGSSGSIVSSQDNHAVQEYFGLINIVKKELPDLVEALTKFPKGADLHNHLSGTVMPEDFIALGSAEGDCFGPDLLVPTMYTIVPATAPGVCGSGYKPLAQSSAEEQQQLLRSFSMYRFNEKGVTSIQTGHDQFFATFVRFGSISGSPGNMGPMLAKLLQQENAENVSHVETMISFQSSAVNRLANQLRLKYPDAAAFEQSVNYPEMYSYLLSAGLSDAVTAAQKDIGTYINAVRTILRCDTMAKDPACEVSLVFQATANRNAALSDGSADLPKIFTQIALSCLLDDTENKVVGVNLLSGEDASVSMKNFTTQMKFFGFFKSRFPGVKIALHAGEITPYFVGNGSPALKEHLTGSIQAGARRLGHAVSFAYLTDNEKNEVIDMMRRNRTTVEINLTSNAQILGVTGDNHPFQHYFRKYGIPVVLSTDDEGVSYSSFTDAWIYATRQYQLTYSEAVLLARSSLQYSFLSGSALWDDIASSAVISQCAGETVGSAIQGEPCKAFLENSEKARAQWNYETKLSNFDRVYGTTLRKYLGN